MLSHLSRVMFDGASRFVNNNKYFWGILNYRLVSETIYYLSRDITFVYIIISQLLFVVSDDSTTLFFLPPARSGFHAYSRESHCRGIILPYY